MMKGYLELVDIKTNNVINTYDDFGLILGHKSIPKPSIKTNYIDNPGGHGTIDLTEADGEVKYDDITASFPFAMVNKFADLPSAISEISNVLHGKKFKIFCYDDPDYYYLGRLSIDEYKINYARGSFVINALVEPFKYKKYKSVYSYDIDGSKRITCFNAKKRVVPEITLDSEMTIEYKGATYVLSAGTHKILNFYFDEGAYDFMVYGTGNIKIEYQEGSL